MQVSEAQQVVLGVELEEQRVEALGGVVDGAGVGRVQDVLLAVARQDHVNVALGDLAARVAVAVHAHGAEVDEVHVVARLGDGAQHIVRGAEVVLDGVPLGGGVPHRVRRGALLGEVDDRVGRLVLDDLREAVVLLRNVEVDVADVLARELLPRLHARLGRGDWGERTAAHLDVDLATREVVDDDNLVALVGQVEGGRPPTEAVTPEHEDLLLLAIAGVSCVRLGRRGRRRRHHDGRNAGSSSGGSHR